MSLILGVLSLIFWIWLLAKLGKWAVKNPSHALKGASILRGVFRK